VITTLTTSTLLLKSYCHIVILSNWKLGNGLAACILMIFGCYELRVFFKFINSCNINAALHYDFVLHSDDET
jgi:hypothetical protein